VRGRHRGRQVQNHGGHPQKAEDDKWLDGGDRSQAKGARGSLKVGAVCGKAARPDLCGGREVTRVPTATWAEGRSERFAEIAREFVNRNVDVIVTSGTAVQAIKQVTSTISIVFAVAVDPVGGGLVSSHKAAVVHQNVKPNRRRACCRSKLVRSSQPGSSIDLPATWILQPMAIQERWERLA
jgi:hypothetical protein